MNAALLAVVGLSMIAIGYRFYSKFLAEKIYQLDPDFETPAHAQRDDIDYVPTNRVVLWGHHFTAVNIHDHFSHNAQATSAVAGDDLRTHQFRPQPEAVTGHVRQGVIRS